MGTRSATGRAGNGVNTVPPGPVATCETDGRHFDDREYSTDVVYSGSDQDSDTGDDEETVCSGGDRRGVKRERSEKEVGHQSAPTSGGLGGGYPVVPGAKPGKKTRGRVKIKMEFIDNKLRRYTTFSKRKTGIMKKVSVSHNTGDLVTSQSTYGESSHSEDLLSLRIRLSCIYYVNQKPQVYGIFQEPSTHSSVTWSRLDV